MYLCLALLHEVASRGRLKLPLSSIQGERVGVRGADFTASGLLSRPAATLSPKGKRVMKLPLMSGCPARCGGL